MTRLLKLHRRLHNLAWSLDLPKTQKMPLDGLRDGVRVHDLD